LRNAHNGHTPGLAAPYLRRTTAPKACALGACEFLSCLAARRSVPCALLNKLAITVLAVAAQLQGACGDTEQDRLVWARERMHPSVTREQLELVYQWLANGTRSCSQSGDLWYYRALTAQRLGNARDAEYSLSKADENGSKAKAESFNPFSIGHAAPARQVTRLRDKWALVVGISSFQNIKDTLEFSGKDAINFRNFLVKDGNFKPGNVSLLVDKDATTRQIREAFGKIRESAQADDLVVIYLSSHGRPRTLDPTGLSYVMTYDTAAIDDKAGVYATALQMVELAELGRWIKAQQYVLLLDTCFSGAAQPGITSNIVPAGAQGIDAFTSALQSLRDSNSSAVIAASRADEQSWDDEQHEDGYFTRYLLDGLRQNAGNFSLASVYEYLRPRVSEEVAQRENQQQHPVMQSFGAGKDIVLTAPLAASAQARRAVLTYRYAR
jgi:uncharacterized caspase-like protein